MRTIITIAALTLFCPGLIIRAAPAKDESIERLMELMHQKQTYEQMITQMDAVIEASAKQAGQAQGSPLTVEQQSVVQKVKTELKTAMPYSTMHEIALKVYREAFTEEDIQGLITFYKSPTGQMYIQKMPTVMAKTMELAQQQIQPAMQELQEELQQELEHMDQ